MKSTIRKAKHGEDNWYNINPMELSKELNFYLSKANKYSSSGTLKSVIVPHAWLRFSGPIMAKSFINVNPDIYNRVIVLGPSHHEYFENCGLSPFQSFATPFGNIPVDTELQQKLLKHKGLFFELPQSTDVEEHSIEMELPYLKYIFDKKPFKLLPIMVGETDSESNKLIGQTLYELYSDPQNLFVISSDFCHWGLRFGYTYYNKEYDEIWKSTEDLDKQALSIIGEMNTKKLDNYFKQTKNTICGRNPISIVLSIIEDYKKNNKDTKINFECAGYAQSSKVINKYDSSVSYASAVNYVGF